MRTNDRLAAAASPRPAVAATGFAALAATIFLLHAAVSHAAQSKPVVSTAKTSLGQILVDSRGRTLYLFGKDKSGKSACTGKCATAWPPLIVSGKLRVAGAARASLVGMTMRADGRMQATYNHHPLYTFFMDTKTGQTNGEGVSAFGGVWDAVSSAGVKVARNTPAPAAGGGYGG